MKKLLALLLALVMVVSLVACGVQNQPEETKAPAADKPEETKAPVEETEAPKEPVTITYHYLNSVGEQEYTDDVEEKLNEILKNLEGYEHISIDLVPHDWNYPSNLALAQANGDQIDIFNTFSLDYTTMIANGDMMELNDLLEAYPGVASDVPDWLIAYGSINGTQYYIPTYQMACNPAHFYAPKEYFEMYYEASGNNRDDVVRILQTGTIEEILDFYEAFYVAVVEATGITTKKMPDLREPFQWILKDEIDGSYGNLVYPMGAEEPVYWPMTEEFKTILKRTNQWYKNGWMLQSGEDPNYDFLTNDNAMVYCVSEGAMSAEDYAKTRSSEAAGELDAISMKKNFFIGSAWAAGGNAIYADCEHPEEAMMIIELLMSEKCLEFFNTLCWGLEGIHYEFVDEAAGKIKTLEFEGSQGMADTTYAKWNWNTGNIFNGWTNQATADGYLEYIEDVIHTGPDTVVSPYMGIYWDFSAVSNELSQVKAVNGEYYKGLHRAEDLDTAYAEYMDKLEAAGIQTIMDEIIKQSDAWLAK